MQQLLARFNQDLKSAGLVKGRGQTQRLTESTDDLDRMLEVAEETIRAEF